MANIKRQVEVIKEESETFQGDQTVCRKDNVMNVFSAWCTSVDSGLYIYIISWILSLLIFKYFSISAHVLWYSLSASRFFSSYCFLFFFKITLFWAAKMAQLIKVLAVKPDDLKSVLCSHMVDRAPGPLSCPLTPTSALWCGHSRKGK